MEKIKSKTRTEVFMRIPLSRLAREVKVVRVSGIVSGFAAADSVGLLARRYCAARPSRPGIRDSGLRGTTPPYSRASATGLHRLPGTESAVDVAKNSASRLGRDAAILRVNELAERKNKCAAQ